MNINELEELAKAAPAAFYLDSDDGLDREFNGIDSFSCGRNGGVPLYAFDQSEIRKLIAAYREAVSALDINTELFDQYDSCHKLSITEPARKRARDALDTAKRLGVE